jgi:hypothetical protein
MYVNHGAKVGNYTRVHYAYLYLSPQPCGNCRIKYVYQGYRSNTGGSVFLVGPQKSAWNYCSPQFGCEHKFNVDYTYFTGDWVVGSIVAENGYVWGRSVHRF